MTGTITERVAQGAALLDEKLPGWAGRIDIGTLRMRDTCQCVLGQLFAIDPEEDDGYWAGLRDLDIPNRPVRIPESYGFAAADPGDYRALDDEWIRVITERWAAA